MKVADQISTHQLSVYNYVLYSSSSGIVGSGLKAEYHLSWCHGGTCAVGLFVESHE